MFIERVHCIVPTHGEPEYNNVIMIYMSSMLSIKIVNDTYFNLNIFIV